MRFAFGKRRGRSAFLLSCSTLLTVHDQEGIAFDMNCQRYVVVQVYIRLPVYYYHLNIERHAEVLCRKCIYVTITSPASSSAYVDLAPSEALPLDMRESTPSICTLHPYHKTKALIPQPSKTDTLPSDSKPPSPHDTFKRMYLPLQHSPPSPPQQDPRPPPRPPWPPQPSSS